MASYATPADLLTRYDARVVGDLVNDTDSQVDPASLAADVVLLQMLEDASGDIESALIAGERYTVANLTEYNATTNPTGISGNSMALLKRMTCDIAYALLLRRRGEINPDKHSGILDLAERHLRELRSGAAVFGLTAQIEAGAVKFSGVGTVEFGTLNLIRDRGNYYPARKIQNGK